MVVASVAALIGLLTLGEYLFGVDLGLDQALMRHYVTVETSNPGRMAPNTALCFIITGAALVVLAKTNARAVRTVGILALLLVVLGSVAFIGYPSSSESSFGWGRITRMAVHTACGFVILGSGLFLAAWARGLSKHSVVAISSLFGTGATVVLWHVAVLHDALDQVMIGGPRGDVLDTHMHGTVVLVAIAGVLCTSAVAFLISQLRKNAALLEHRVAERTRELGNQKYAMDEHSLVEITDPSGKITYANDKFCQVSQYSREELIGKNHLIINSGYHPLAFWGEVWKTIEAGDVWHGEICNRAKDGSTYWVDTTIVPFKNADGCISQYFAIRTDITERKQAEETLTRLGQRLRTSIDQMPIAYILWDDKFRVVEWNPAAERVFGYSKSEMVGKNPLTYIVPEPARPAVHATIKKLLAGEKSDYSEEENNLRKNGDVISCRWYNTPLKDETGTTLAVLSMAIDVTERKRVENELRKLSVAAEQSPAMVVITDTHGKIEYVNPSFTKTTGYTNDEVIGKNPRIFKSGKWPKKAYEGLWNTILSGQTWRGEFENKKKNGELYWESASISPVLDSSGEITQFLAVKEDITARKRAEKQRETLIHDMGERVKEMTCMYAVTESIRERPALEELFSKVAISIPPGWHYPRITRCNVRFDGREYVSEPFEETEWKQSSDIVVDGECRGAIEVYYMEPCPELDEGPFMKQERNLLDGIAHTLSSAIENKLADDATKEAKIQAEAANHAKSEFLANMSHEIRTPMTAILGFAENLKDSTLSESERLKCVQTIRHNGENLLAIINDILDLSKIEAGKMDAKRGDCEPCAVVANVCSLVRVHAEAKGLQFKIEYEGVIPKMIRTDAARLRQILINLVGNAIKFTEVGTIRILIRFVGGAKDGRGGSTKEPCLQFDVIDTGRGMTEEEAGKLFQPFMQVDTSATRQVGGTGLGLTISKRFANMLGGDITIVETEPGVGSTFRATVATGSLKGVPMLENPLSATCVAGNADTAEPASRSELQGIRILLAEDGPDNQRLISFFLKRAGAEVTVKENGKLAFEAAMAAMNRRRKDDPEHPFDLILMDMQMPVMDGYEATGQLRQKGYTQPIIALTAYAMEGDREKCIEVGCDGYATKPVDRKNLIDLILEHVDQDGRTPISNETAATKQLVLRGCRILLAEDNPTNQVLVVGILKKAGAEITVVQNGKLALEKAMAACESGRPFDIILMDLQMPLMGGVEATKLLRDKAYTGTIIAVTAHAIKGDRQKYIKTGFDDYATKPINRVQLLGTIQAHFRKSGSQTPVDGHTSDALLSDSPTTIC